MNTKNYQELIINFKNTKKACTENKYVYIHFYGDSPSGVAYNIHFSNIHIEIRTNAYIFSYVVNYRTEYFLISFMSYPGGTLSFYVLKSTLYI